MVLLPVSARLAWWGSAWLRGTVSPDVAVTEILGQDATHRVEGLPGEEGTVGLALALGHLRARGGTGLGLAWPTPGDPVGLGGPPALNAAALEAGEAAVGAADAFVPRREGAVIVWTRHPTAPRQLTDVGEADRRLRAALVDAAARLAGLDVARWRPEVADALMDLRRLVPVPAPDGTPVRCVGLAARALQAATIVELAVGADPGAGLPDDLTDLAGGGLVTAAEADVRRSALRDLDSAARHALVAACSPEAWPPD